jgi:hypothetical protein
MSQADYYGKCRDECASEVNIYECIQKCLDKPLVDAVSAEYGSEIGNTCYGYNERLREAMYVYDPEHVVSAKKQAGEVSRSLQDIALRYYMQPIAPYPPGSAAPKGLRNADPDYKSLLAFIKKDPCDKYRFLAEAKKSLGDASEPTPPSTPATLTWKGWVGGAFLAYGLWYFWNNR